MTKNNQPMEGELVVDKATGQDSAVISIQVSLGDLMVMQQEASQLVFKPQAEDAIIALLDLQERVNTAVEMVKDAIATQGTEYDPTFTSVSGNRVKANYQQSGAKYKIDQSQVERLRPPYFQKKISYSLDTKLVEKYEMAHKGRLPKGVVKVANRNKNVILKVK